MNGTQLDDMTDLGRIRALVLEALGRDGSQLTMVLLVEHLVEQYRAMRSAGRDDG